MFKVLRSNTEIAITPPRIAQCRQKFGTEFRHITDDILQMFKVKFTNQGHRVKDQGHNVM